MLGTDEQLLAEFLRLPGGLDSWANAGVLVGCVAAVSVARFSLMNAWPDFRWGPCRSRQWGRGGGALGSMGCG